MVYRIRACLWLGVYKLLESLVVDLRLEIQGWVCVIVAKDKKENDFRERSLMTSFEGLL